MSGELYVIGLRAFLAALPQPRRRTLKTRLIEFLESRRGIIVSRDEIAIALWGHRADGGPEYARGTIAATVMHARRDGVPIIANHTRGYTIAEAR